LLTHLIFYASYLEIQLDHLPHSLTFLKINSEDGVSCHLDHLPPFLTYLEALSLSVSHCFNLPPSLRYFRCRYLENNENEGLDYLPSDLEYLDIGFSECNSLGNLPPSLTHLRVRQCGEMSNIFGIDYLPPLLTHLNLSGVNQQIDHLPQTLTHLTLGKDFCQDLHYLPSSLTNLTLSNWYFSQLCYLPASLRFLTIKHCNGLQVPDSYVDPQPLVFQCLPKWLKSIVNWVSGQHSTPESSFSEISATNAVTATNDAPSMKLLDFLPLATQLVYQECDTPHNYVQYKCQYITKKFHQPKLEILKLC